MTTKNILGACAIFLCACSATTSTPDVPAPGGASTENPPPKEPPGAGDDGDPPPDPPPAPPSTRRTLAGPWVSFYGKPPAAAIAKTASSFHTINVEADPDADTLTDADITALKAGGKNTVISYMNVGACETYRTYFADCQATGALTTVYSSEYPDERWANLSNAAYRKLVVETIAPRLVARGVDGFFLDNMEVIEHGADADAGPCDDACAQGGLDLVWELRQKFPDKIIIMQNATGDVARLGKTHGASFPSILDGVSHEETETDSEARAQMIAWKGLVPWRSIEEYVGSCSASAKKQADGIYARAKADGLEAYVTDASSAQSAPCFWSDFP